MRIQFPYAGSKTCDVLLVEIGSAYRFPLAATRTHLGVGQAFRLRLFQRLMLDQQSGLFERSPAGYIGFARRAAGQISGRRVSNLSLGDPASR